MVSKLPQINARVTDEQLEIIESLSNRLGLSKAEFIRLAIAEYVAVHGENDKPFYDTPAHGGRRDK